MDMALNPYYPGGDPWWLPLAPSNNPFTFRFQMSSLGMMLTRFGANILETIGFYYL